MYYRACVVSKDMAFAGFVRLTLLTRLRQVTITEGDYPPSDIYVIDLDTIPLPNGLSGKVLCCSYSREKPSNFPYLWVDRPFRPARLLALLDLACDDDDTLTLHPERLTCTLGGQEVTFSKCEFALLTALYEADGAFLTREALLRAVWGDGETDPSLVNVYIHYLRKKLESGGKKYIYSKRGRGYALILREEDNPC
jgi:hypothetical protein